MIRSEFGHVEVKGSTPTVFADLAMLANAIAKDGLRGMPSKEECKKELISAIELGFAEDFDKTFGDSDIGKNVMKVLDDILGMLMKGNGEK